jgi:hypothetical protein
MGIDGWFVNHTKKHVIVRDIKREHGYYLKEYQYLLKNGWNINDEVDDVNDCHVTETPDEFQDYTFYYLSRDGYGNISLEKITGSWYGIPWKLR